MKDDAEKEPRPAAKKIAARRKAKMAMKRNPQRRVGIIAHHRLGLGMGLSMAALALLLEDRNAR